MMDLSKQLSESNERLEKAHNELQIVYQLAGLMFMAIEFGNREDRLKAACDFDEWLHAGEIVSNDDDYE